MAITDRKKAKKAARTEKRRVEREAGLAKQSAGHEERRKEGEGETAAEEEIISPQAAAGPERVSRVRDVASRAHLELQLAMGKLLVRRYFEQPERWADEEVRERCTRVFGTEEDFVRAMAVHVAPHKHLLPASVVEYMGVMVSAFSVVAVRCLAALSNKFHDESYASLLLLQAHVESAARNAQDAARLADDSKVAAEKAELGTMSSLDDLTRQVGMVRDASSHIEAVAADLKQRHVAEMERQKAAFAVEMEDFKKELEIEKAACLKAYKKDIEANQAAWLKDQREMVKKEVREEIVAPLQTRVQRLRTQSAATGRAVDEACRDFDKLAVETKAVSAEVAGLGGLSARMDDLVVKVDGLSRKLHKKSVHWAKDEEAGEEEEKGHEKLELPGRSTSPGFDRGHDLFDSPPQSPSFGGGGYLGGGGSLGGGASLAEESSMRPYSPGRISPPVPELGELSRRLGLRHPPPQSSGGPSNEMSRPPTPGFPFYQS
ncbi:hypothetical protein KC354_g15083 [Hortaea werneckii]|nr:hypothetical protein KC354_g15083 [Hortaea werneckii]